ncbi:GNAT family N-acetyltransferase [Alkaliphilus pronyensis]|uniref:GNAT family N-acetyltransferase n=1 Tax=Alkaliphilus pronyensis TaxID=1482732 RepID=A0A6I0EXK9_9FIRM|nr:GNAT family protein [Alkaliphilus pronyensis]KAB3534001.1 GNAT family N-acetyltransferase [Alkaliphilus pronyensis]
MEKYIVSSGEEIIIRPAKKEDAQQLIDYIQIIAGESDYLTFGPGEFLLTKEEEESFIEKTLKSNNSLFLVAEIDGKIVANLSFTGGVRPRTKQAGEFGVSVLKRYWGLGIGKRLVSYLINWSRQTGVVRKINLKVRADNTRGITLYENLGFKKEGLISREFMIDGIFYDCILMGIEID